MFNSKATQSRAAHFNGNPIDKTTRFKGNAINKAAWFKGNAKKETTRLDIALRWTGKVGLSIIDLPVGAPRTLIWTCCQSTLYAINTRYGQVLQIRIARLSSRSLWLRVHPSELNVLFRLRHLHRSLGTIVTEEEGNSTTGPKELLTPRCDGIWSYRCVAPTSNQFFKDTAQTLMSVRDGFRYIGGDQFYAGKALRTHATRISFSRPSRAAQWERVFCRWKSAAHGGTYVHFFFPARCNGAC